MPFKYILLAVLILYNQDIVCSHILTSRDLPMASCMKMLTFAVHDLCGIYGESSSEEAFDPSRIPQLVDKRYTTKPFIIKRCCTQPCTVPELLSAC